MDTICIKQLKLRTTIGAYAWEQQIKQQLLLDLTYPTDTQSQASDDDLQQQFDYATIAKRIDAFVADKKTALLETLANDIAEFCLQDLMLSKVELTLHKPGAVANASGVSLSLVRP